MVKLPYFRARTATAVALNKAISVLKEQLESSFRKDGVYLFKINGEILKFKIQNRYFELIY